MQDFATEIWLKSNKADMKTQDTSFQVKGSEKRICLNLNR